jgi:hypothetical protein
MSQTLIPTIDTTAIDGEIAPLVARAQALVVDSRETYDVAQRELVGAARIEKFIEGVYADPTRILFKAHKDMVAQRTAKLGPVQTFRSIVGHKVAAYEIEAQRKAEDERARLEAAARKAEEERTLAAAIDAEQSGDQAAAEEIMAAPVEIPVIRPEPAFMRAEGVSSRTLYSAEPEGGEIASLMALARHVVAHPEDANLIQPNTGAINGRARSQRDGFQLPGYRLVKRTNMAVRTAESA